MKIVHVVKALLRDSGVGVFVAEVASAQSRALHQVAILCRWYPECEADKNVDYRIDPKLVAFSALSRRDIAVHIHAFWAWYSLRVLLRCRCRGIPYVVSPHGGLMPRVFTRGRVKKYLAWQLLLKPLVRRAAAIHCTGEAEQSAVRRLLGKRCPPIVIAPLGVHLPEFREKPKKEVKVVLFLGRLGEEKGLVNLLDAWHQVKREGWQLVLAGPDWEGYRQVLLDKCHALGEEVVARTSQTFKLSDPQTSRQLLSTSLDLGLRSRPISFPGPVDGDAKASLYRSADIFVLPSPMENFSHAVLEALSYGVPVIATKGTPWEELESEHCGRWIGQGVEPLAAALSELMSMSDGDRMTMGVNGRKLVAARYRWETVAKSLEPIYQFCEKSN